MRRKVELLPGAPVAERRDWWDDELFLGLARLRGMECRTPVRRGISRKQSNAHVLNPLR